ncbi:hypothetical protein P8C59_009469 [Phyllachora maydis]|uniref:Pyridoxamine 5'-phosphate oxidase N-terminal domain-containing protein n=1 Tax=Phyllachora maydis TaxID=1825666 RepID=A0AAD9ICK5_9PEZI|nr:hypothetical protein P8C59_009469 [Phyllachora maydis]
MDRITPDRASDPGASTSTTTLPPELVHCLEKNRFLHLATCAANVPHVSLMNYTYLATSPHTPPGRPLIVMTVCPDSRKMDNLAVNPSVSLLVHDWILPPPPGQQQHQPRRLSGDNNNTTTTTLITPTTTTSLAPLLFNLNTSAVASISATMGGTARLAARGSAEERFFRAAHLAHSSCGGAGAGAETVDDGGAGAPGGPYVAGEDKRVVLVEIRTVRIADLKGGVRDWEIVPPGEGPRQEGVNGIR